MLAFKLGGISLRMSAADLADLLLVDTPNDDLGGLGNVELDSLRRLDRDRVREAERKLEGLAAQLGAVADPLDLEALLITLGDSLHHVGDQAARQPVQGAVLAPIGGALDCHGAVGQLDLHVRGDLLVKLALGTLDRAMARLDVNRDAVWNWNWLSTDAAHKFGARCSVLGFGLMLEHRRPSTDSPHVRYDLTPHAFRFRFMPGHQPHARWR